MATRFRHKLPESLRRKFILRGNKIFEVAGSIEGEYHTFRSANDARAHCRAVLRMMGHEVEDRTEAKVTSNEKYVYKAINSLLDTMAEELPEDFASKCPRTADAIAKLEKLVPDDHKMRKYYRAR